MKVSAFADEIDDDPRVQVDVLLEAGIRGLDLRSAWGTNVLDLSDDQVDALVNLLQEREVTVTSIGTPIGKTPIDGPFDLELRRLDRAIGVARRCDTRAVRIFSFYGPSDESHPPEAYRAEVMARMDVLHERARDAGLVLLHENERGIFGDTASRCAELCTRFGGPHFAAVFDPANFIQCGESPYPSAYELLREWIAAVHVKDATVDGQVVPAGEGAANFPTLLQRLRADGFDGPLSLEPHLATAGKLGGTSGPELFREASGALERLLSDLDWAHE